MPEKIRTLRFDFEAIIKLEELGINLLDGGLKEADVKKPQTFSTLYWVGRLAETPELTEAAARKELRGIPVRDVVNAITTALTTDLGGNADSVQNPPAAS